MSLLITSPPYSFVSFNAPGRAECCDGINSLCLPVLSNNDLCFEVISTDGAPGVLEVVAGEDGSGAVISSQSGFTATPDPNVYSWQSNIDIEGLDCDECFVLRIDGVAISNAFKKVCNDCFTAVFEYTNSTDYAGFIYCNAAFSNRVRLYVTLKNGRMNEDRSVYRKSQGAYILTKSIITKEYLAVTEFMPVEFHDALMVALAHDSISIDASNYQGGITLSGAYNPAWEDDLCIAPAEFKIEITPLVIRNNNCQVCADPVDPPTCLGVTIAASDPMPAPVIDTPYSYIFSFTGDAPVIISADTLPAWLTASILAPSVHLSGTPTGGDLDADIPLTVTLSNCAGASTVVFEGEIFVTPCVPVDFDISGVPDLPDGTVGTPYSFSFDVVGDVPYDFTFINVPSWMSFGASGSTINLTGTPDVEGPGLDVQFNITNCAGANAISIVQAIDVGPAALTATLTYSRSVGGGGVILVDLSVPIDADITLDATYIDGYDTGSCTGSVTAHLDALGKSILTGSTSYSGADTQTGSWATAASFVVYNVLVNGGIVVDGDIITIGSYSVAIVFDGC